MDEKLKKLNLRSTGDDLLDIEPDSIKTIIPKDKLTLIQEGDADPFYKIQKIDYPAKANGYIYQESFFKSFLKKLKRAPIPGSKDGHETAWGARPKTDFYLIGGSVKSNGDKTGSVFFKNYIPTEDNELFIKENRLNLIDFSLVAFTKDEVSELPDGSREYHVIESLGGERNDAVEYGMGAMEQKTNKIDNIGENKMGKEDILKGIKTLKANLELTLEEVAKVMNCIPLLITDAQKENLAKHNAVVKLCGEADPLEFIEGLMKERKDNVADVRTAKIDKEFGPVEFPDTKQKNRARVCAENLLGKDELTDEKVKEIKSNELYKELALERSDITNDANIIGVREGKKENTTTPEVVDY